jgi:hypothetical protein
MWTSLLPLAAFMAIAFPAAAAEVAPIQDHSGVIARALLLTGHPEQRVILFDPQQYDADHRRKLERLEAFVLRGGTDIYLNCRGRAYKEASGGEPQGVYVLAAILAHETAHLQGKNERTALAEERELIYGFMKTGHVSSDVALQHLQSTWEQRQ